MSNTCFSYTETTRREKKTTDEQIDEQKKGGHQEATHACKKSEKLKSFLIQKGNCCSQKMSSRRKKIKNIKGQTKKE